MLFRYLLCASVCAPLLAAGPKIVGGPVVVNVTPRTATVVWVVETDQLALHPPTGAAKTSPSLNVEKTTLTGLQANTRYEYETGGPDGVKGSFKTPPAPPSTRAATAANGASATPPPPVPFRFVVYGDTRTRHDVHRRVIQQVLAHGIPDFVVHTGDLVADGNDTSLWPIFFDIERELLRGCAFYPALGNHERNARDYYDYFALDTPYYGFNWGNAHFSVINSDYANAATSKSAKDAFWAEQSKWLEDDLAASQKSDFRFVAAHHPPMSAVSSRQEFNVKMEALVPMLEKYHVTAGFFGHDHNYQHYLQRGIHYVITGGGGAPLYDVDKPPRSILVKAISTENFVSVTVDGKVAKVQAIAADGRTLDEFEMHAQ